MKNRIQIDGVWYIKEEQDTIEDVFLQDPVETKNIFYESDLFTFEAWKIKGSEIVDGIDTKCKKDFREKSVTNDFFISNLIDNEYDVDWDEEDTEEYKEQLTLVAKDLRKRGWV